MEIIISFRRKGKEVDETLTLSPEEYFDPIEPDETYEEDAITRLNQTCDYLSLRPDELDWTQVDIRGDHDFSRTIRTDYRSNGVVEIMQIMGRDRSGVFDEDLCITTRIEENRFHIVRLYRSGSPRWSMTGNAIVTLHNDGPDTEVSYR